MYRFEQTGTVRPPRAGEWYLDEQGKPDEALVDFRVRAYPILRRKLSDDHTESIFEAANMANESLSLLESFLIGEKPDGDRVAHVLRYFKVRPIVSVVVEKEKEK